MSTIVDPVAGPVSAYTEWDPLEEVIVGVADGATVPPCDVMTEATMPRAHAEFFRTRGGRPFPDALVSQARKELDELVEILVGEGVTVRRPDRVDHGRRYATPDWTCASGVYAAMPRDLLLVIGDEIIEAPLAWRSRYFEVHAYRELLKAYFRGGARWTAAPRPTLRDAQYDPFYDRPDDGTPERYAVTEFEPTFDAADFLRCGRDIFAQRSHVTNALGIEWLRRHLAPRYRVHEVRVHDAQPMHIDATLVPLAPGKLLVNPKRLPEIPPAFASWDIIPAPPPRIPDDVPLYMSSKWVSMNVLSVDEQRVIVERDEEPLIAQLRSHGFKPIPCPFRAFNGLGGAFHCATLDVRRRGALQSYF
jgi:glycine amidinotransferase